MSSKTKDEENRQSYEKVGRIYNLLRHNTHKIYLENLLQTKGDINYRISEGNATVPNLLHAAIQSKELLVLLLESGVDFTYKYEEGRTVVHEVMNDCSLCQGHTEQIDIVLNAHVQFNNFSNPTDNNGITHFHAACMSGNASAVEFFLKNGVDVNHTVNEGSNYFPAYTPLHFALEYTRSNVVEILLRYGANVHLKNAAGLSIIHVIIKKRIEEYENRRRSVQGQKPLVELDEILKIYVNFVIDDENEIEVVDDYGFCNLHVACILQDDDLIMRVLGTTKNINQAVIFDAPVCPGYTALHFATFSKVEIFTLLLDNGGDIEAKNFKRETPFDLALQNYSAKDIYFIVMNVPDWRNIVLSDNKTKLVSIIFDMRKENEPFSFPNHSTTDFTIFVPFDSPVLPGYTILHLAVIFTKGNVDFAKISDSLERGADIDAKNAKGLTPHDLACYMEKMDLVNYFSYYRNKRDNPKDEYNVCYSPFVDFGDEERRQILQTMEKRRHINVPFCSEEDLLLLVKNFENGMDNSQDEKNLDRLRRAFQFLTSEHNYWFPSKKLLQFYSSAATAFEKLKVSNTDLRTNQGISIFHVVCLTAKEDVVEKFLKHNAFDVNQTISYFSDDSPGSTPLHLVIENFHRNKKRSTNSFLRIVDVLLINGANVNATDAFGDTPIFQAVRLPTPSLRQTVIDKLISYGANIHVTNVRGNTPFDLSLTFGYSWEEIQVFLKAGCSFDSYNPITQEGHMFTAFRTYSRKQTKIPHSISIILGLINTSQENRVLREIFHSPKISEVNNAGRTAIHNVVSVGLNGQYYYEIRSQVYFQEEIKPISSEVWAEMIESLVKRGCDIDAQDNEGKTALHLAVFQNNLFGVYGLLKSGTDVNLTDKNGKTIFAYHCSSSESHDGRSMEYKHDARVILAMHVYKLKFCGEYVSQQCEELQIEDEYLKNYSFGNDDFNRFHEEMKRTKNIKIGKTLEFSVYEFLMRNDMDMVYMNLTTAECAEVDRFFGHIDKYKFQEIVCLLKLKYRRNIERIKLIEPALASFSILIKNQLPDLCCRCIISYLKNRDLKQLIMSTA